MQAGGPAREGAFELSVLLHRARPLGGRWKRKEREQLSVLFLIGKKRHTFIDGLDMMTGILRLYYSKHPQCVCVGGSATTKSTNMEHNSSSCHYCRRYNKPNSI